MSVEFVCHDINGNTDWKYDPEQQIYLRFNQQNEVIARIMAKHLPDPWNMWKMRLDASMIEASSREGQMLKPQEAVFDLWKHKLKMSMG